MSVPAQVPHNINFREKKLKQSKKKPESAGGEEPGGPRGRVARFRYFEDIYGYSGVSATGQIPPPPLRCPGFAEGPPVTISYPPQRFLSVAPPRTGCW